MITELRGSLAQQAERVTPAPDPYGRLLVRRRRRRRRTGVVLATLLVLAILPGAWALTVGLPERAPDGYVDAGQPPTRLLAALLDSPTRGSLAADTGLLDGLRDRAPKEVERMTDGARGPFLPQDPTLIRILFAGDVPGGRLVILGGVSRWPLEVTYWAAPGTPVDRLQMTGFGELEPVVRAERLTEAGGYSLVMGPAGSRVAVSDRARYHADGSITRSWTEEPAGYLLRDTRQLAPGGRVRLTYDGAVLLESALHSGAGTDPEVSIDPAPVSGRGKAIPAAAVQAARALARGTGLSDRDAHFQVLWCDEVPMAGLTNGSTAAVVTVQAMTPDGGGPYATYAFDLTGAEPLARDHPSGAGVAGPPDRTLIVMRLPYFARQTDTLMVVAPPGAVRAEAVVAGDGTIVATADLSQGVGKFALAARTGVQVNLTVRTFDPAGRPVIQAKYTEVGGEPLPSAGLEPETRGW